MEDQHEAVVAHEMDGRVPAVHPYSGEPLHQQRRLPGRDAAGTAVDQQTVPVERAEVAAGRDVALTELQPDA